MSGKDFNEKFGSKQYVKLTRESCVHNSYLYKDGLNTDTKEFNPDKTCNEGGFHFCARVDFVKWLLYTNVNDPMYYIWDVIIPDNALVTIMDGGIIKCNQFILCNKRFIWNNYDMCKEIVQTEGLMLHYVEQKIQTDDLCKEALRKDIRAIGFVIKPTHEVYMEYVRLNVKNIENIPDHELTPELCVKLLEINSEVLPFIKSPSEEVLIFMVKEDGMKLKDIKNQTQNICMEAVIQNKKCFKFVQIEFRDKCKAYIKDYYDNLRMGNSLAKDIN
jgi:hypothetical protein